MHADNYLSRHISGNKESRSIPIHFAYFILVVISITFDQPTYSIDEEVTQLVPTITLSNPASFDFSVSIFAEDGTATGEYYWM